MISEIRAHRVDLPLEMVPLRIGQARTPTGALERLTLAGDRFPGKAESIPELGFVDPGKHCSDRTAKSRGRNEFPINRTRNKISRRGVQPGRIAGFWDLDRSNLLGGFDRSLNLASGRVHFEKDRFRSAVQSF